MITRVIPRLDIKGPNLVKGVHLEGLRVLAKPEAAARFYYEEGADELLFMDVVASLYGRTSLLDIIERVASEIFIPLTVGGGIRTLADIHAVLRAGADKVSINTAAVRNPKFIEEASRRFGSSTIVVSIEATLQGDGRYEAYVDNGREKTGLDAIDWAEKAAELGAGEILVTSVDREGTGLGYDLDLIRKIADLVPVPVIACGGAGTAAHPAEAVAAGASAVAVASVLHYRFMQHNHIEQDEVGSEVNLAHLRRPGFSRVEPATLEAIKANLASSGYASRSTETV